jgi:hypothetical protein
VACAVNEKLFICCGEIKGGFTNTIEWLAIREPLNQLTWNLLKVFHTITPKVCPGAVHIGAGKMLLFGGEDLDERHQDLHVINTVSETISFTLKDSGTEFLSLQQPISFHSKKNLVIAGDTIRKQFYALKLDEQGHA